MKGRQQSIDDGGFSNMSSMCLLQVVATRERQKGKIDCILGLGLRVLLSDCEQKPPIIQKRDLGIMSGKKT